MSTHILATAAAVGVVTAFLAAGTATAHSQLPATVSSTPGFVTGAGGESVIALIASQDEGGKPAGDAEGKGKGKGDKGKGKGKGKGKAEQPGE